MTDELPRRDELRDFASVVMAETLRLAKETYVALDALRLSALRSPSDLAVEELARSHAVADLLALAVFADGGISDDEWTALEEACARIGQRGVDAREATRHWRRRMEEIADRDQWVAQIRATAAPLCPEDRREVFAHIERFAQNGAGIASGEHTYRDFRVVDPDALLEAFREAMELDAETAD